MPPRFDRAAGLHTLRTLRSLRPSRLAFTHFGIADDAVAQFDRYEKALKEWFDLVSDLLCGNAPASVADIMLSAPVYADLSPVERKELAMCVRGAVATLQYEAAHTTGG